MKLSKITPAAGDFAIDCIVGPEEGVAWNGESRGIVVDLFEDDVWGPSAEIQWLDGSRSLGNWPLDRLVILRHAGNNA